MSFPTALPALPCMLHYLAYRIRYRWASRLLNCTTLSISTAMGTQWKNQRPTSTSLDKTSRDAGHDERVEGLRNQVIMFDMARIRSNQLTPGANEETVGRRAQCPASPLREKDGPWAGNISVSPCFQCLANSGFRGC